MFLNFSDSVGNDLSVYDEDEAWPSLFDDFVEYENDQANQNYETTVRKPDFKEGSSTPLSSKLLWKKSKRLPNDYWSKPLNVLVFVPEWIKDSLNLWNSEN